jgi:hypothetical protein
MQKSHIAVFTLLLTLVIACVFFINDYHRVTPKTLGGEEGEKSQNLEVDVAMMFETTLKKFSNDKNLIVSTEKAIESANRVFNSIELYGKSRDEIVDYFVNKISPSYSYNFPFSPKETNNSIVLRFDNGFYGWQFEIQFDDSHRCIDVKRRWIH